MLRLSRTDVSPMFQKSQILGRGTGGAEEIIGPAVSIQKNPNLNNLKRSLKRFLENYYIPLCNSHKFFKLENFTILPNVLS